MQTTRSFFLLLAGLSAGACASDASEPAAPTDVDPGIDVPALVTSVRELSPTMFEKANMEVLASSEHRGANVDIYVSTGAIAGYRALAEGEPAPAFAEGTTIVKVVADGDDQGVRTVMVKAAPGYAPNHGDWYWLMLAPDGAIAEQGRVSMCTGCHQAARDRDWAFGLE